MRRVTASLECLRSGSRNRRHRDSHPSRRRAVAEPNRVRLARRARSAPSSTGIAEGKPILVSAAPPSRLRDGIGPRERATRLVLDVESATSRALPRHVGHDAGTGSQSARSTRQGGIPPRRRRAIVVDRMFASAAARRSRPRHPRVRARGVARRRPSTRNRRPRDLDPSSRIEGAGILRLRDSRTLERAGAVRGRRLVLRRRTTVERVATKEPAGTAPSDGRPDRVPSRAFGLDRTDSDRRVDRTISGDPDRLVPGSGPTGDLDRPRAPQRSVRAPGRRSS